MSQVLLCARRFHTLNRGISFRRIQILLNSFWKRDRENFFYKFGSNVPSLLKIFSDETTWIRNEVKSGDQAVLEMKSLDWACGKWSENWSCYRCYTHAGDPWFRSAWNACVELGPRNCKSSWYGILYLSRANHQFEESQTFWSKKTSLYRVAPQAAAAWEVEGLFFSRSVNHIFWPRNTAEPHSSWPGFDGFRFP